MSTTTVKRSPRERLLDAAMELFYAEGVHSVGIDRVIERAGVAKASLYNTFGSKEGLVLAYLERRHDLVIDRLHEAVDENEDPVERLLAMFDAQADLFRRPDFRGCAFAAASAEAAADGQIAAATVAYRKEVRDLFAELARGIGVADPDQLADQLRLVYDGGSVAANLDHNPGISSTARTAARTLIDAAITTPSTRRRPPK
jgi:AcrR family transcriptional regulator